MPDTLVQTTAVVTNLY